MKTINKKGGRKELVKLLVGTGVEIGVEQGRFSEAIMRYNTNGKLYCVDAWKPYRDYTDHTRKSKLNRFYENTKTRLAIYNCELIKKFSMDAVKMFPDNFFDFVYIDANHNYKSVTEDIIEWAKKVKPRGIVSGHDYTLRPGRGDTYEVVRAVNDYVKANKIKDLYVWQEDGDLSNSWMFYHA